MPLPSWIKLATGVPARADLAAVYTPVAETQANLAAENAPLPIVYGLHPVGARLANVLVYQRKLIVQAVWCEGEIDSVQSVTLNNAALPAGTTATHYTGTAGQTVNATLVAAFAAQGIAYADALPGIAYSVFAIPATDSAGEPNLVALIKGKKVLDPRTATTAWSDCPALCLADFCASTVYGLGVAVDATSVGVVADDNDALVGGKKRRRIGLMIDGVRPTRQWIEALRAYAGCWVVDSGAGLKLVSDRPRAVDHTVTAADMVAGSFRLRQLGVADLPTVVIVKWTDTTTTPWSEKTAIAKAAGVDEGTTPRRESEVPLQGIQTYAQALRDGTERLNHFNLENIEAEWEAFDEALAYEKGDRASVTHPVGITAKDMRITDVRPSGPGRWKVAAREYDAAAYSDAVAAEPSSPDTSLPSPAEPPALTGLDAVEEVYQMQNGIWTSRIKLSWDVPDYIYLANFRVEIRSGADLIATASPTDALWRSGPVQEGVRYVCKVAAVTTLPAVGEWAQKNVTPLGKYLVPGDVPSVTAFEAGGEVFGQCEPAVDIDIWRYEWRYWPQTGGYTWATGTLIDLADSLRCRTKQIPVGDWVLGVKAIDSIGQYSENAATTNVSVTSDAAAFFVDTRPFETPTLTNMAAYTLARTDPNTYYVTEDGVAWDTKFSAAMDTYTNPLATYHNSVTSTWESEGEDFGQILSGQWTGTATVAAITGSLTSYIGLSDDGSTDPYDWASGLSRKATGRFAKLKHESLTTATLSVTVPTQNIRLDVVPREERISGTTSSTGAYTVNLDGVFTEAIAVLITPLGTTDLSYAVDNIVLGVGGSFDLYIFDGGTQVACAFIGIFKGV